MLAGARGKGLLLLRKSSATSVANQPLLLSRRCIVSSTQSSVGGDESTKDATPSRNHQIRVYHEAPSPIHQIRVYQETPPSSRHRKLKVPTRKCIIRAKSSASAAIPSFPLTERKPKEDSVTLRRQIFDPSLEPNFNGTLEPHLNGHETIDNLHINDDDNIDALTTDDTDEETLPISSVEAFYAAKTIDLTALVNSSLPSSATRWIYQRDSILLELSSVSCDMPSYVAVYRFGSIVFVNVNPRLKTKLLKSVKKFASEPSVTGLEKRENFGLLVNPDAPVPRVTTDHCVVQELDMNAVGVISEVLAKSVALDAYSETVDNMLDNFAQINSKISTSSKMDLDKKMLFSKIAQNNRIFIDLISKLRIKARSQIAWDKGEYEVIHSGMLTEFDIDDRFELIQFKLDLIQQNSKLFLEVIHHQKSASVEWVIVWLIGFECILMCLDMSGQGSIIYEHAVNYFA